MLEHRFDRRAGLDGGLDVALIADGLEMLATGARFWNGFQVEVLAGAEPEIGLGGRCDEGVDSLEAGESLALVDDFQGFAVGVFTAAGAVKRLFRTDATGTGAMFQVGGDIPSGQATVTDTGAAPGVQLDEGVID